MFFPTGESAFIKILEALKNAKHYIFLEYFIIQDGKMWSSIYSILKEKAKQGVRIRVLYDDIGCFLTLPKNFPAMLHDDGIECKVFNPFRPILSSIQNNRDHRKILSVDGRIAITGGFNLADEYINEISKHGYWKDTGILLSGEAAWSLTVMFLQMWDLVSGTDEDYTLYLPQKLPTQVEMQTDLSSRTVTVLWIENISVNMSTYKLSIMRESIFISTLHI